MKSQLELNMQNDSSIPLRQYPDHNNHHNDNSPEFRRNIPADNMDNDSLGTSDSPHQRQLTQLKERTRCFLIGLAVLISFISLTLAIFAIAKYSETADRLKLALENQGRLCLPCSENLLQEAEWRYKNEYGECCVRQEDLLSTISKIAEARVDGALRREEHKRLSKQSSLSGIANSTQVIQRQSAHLKIRSEQSNINRGTTGNHFLKWDDNRSPSTGSSQHLEGVNYDRSTGSITITVSGYYFVYCQVGTELSTSSTLLSGSLWYTVVKVADHNDHEVIQRKEFVWQPRQSSDSIFIQETYLGGMVNLNAGDSVYVRRKSEFISTDITHNSYFGLFRV